MYTIIGGDGNEYGPVTTREVRDWIAAGRANLDTKARAAGAEEWRRLGDFADFGGTVPAPDAAAPGTGSGGEARPFPPGTDAKAIATDLIARAGKLDIGSCYERSWALLKNHFWALVGVATLIFVLESALSYIPHLGIFTGRLLDGLFEGGLYYYFLKKIRGQSADVGDAFAGFSRAFVPLLLAAGLVAVFEVVGLFMLVLPFIYLYVAYSFTYALVIDRGMGFWTAMEVSRQVVTAQWWRVLGLALLSIPFMLLGVAAFFVGFFVALALATGAMAYAYQDLCHPPRR